MRSVLAPLALLVPHLALAAPPTPIQVAIEHGGSSTSTATDLAAQLEDDTFFDFSTTIVSADEIDSEAELAAFDVVIVSDSGYGDADWTPEMAAALVIYASNGGGVVTTSWTDYALTEATPEGVEVLDDVMPTDAWPDSTDYWCSGNLSLEISATPHPVTDGLPSSITTPTSTNMTFSPLALESGGIALGTGVGDSCVAEPVQALVVGEVGLGRVVLVGLMYAANPGYSPGDLRTGDADQLLEQIVNWAAAIDSDADGSPVDLDCDDSDSAVNPEAEEICDAVDNDCDGTIDVDATDATTWHADADDDGFTDPATSVTACAAPEGYAAATEPDCDDTDAGRYPGLAEILDDGIDQDCDGEDEVTPEDTDEPEDTDVPEDTDAEDTDAGESDKGCGCTSAGGAGGTWALLLGLLVATRRGGRREAR